MTIFGCVVRWLRGLPVWAGNRYDPGDKALCDDLVQLSTMTLSNICRRAYALTLDEIEKQLLIQNKVSLALDEWTSTNKLAIMSVIAYYMHRNWALCERQLSCDEVDRLFHSRFES
jgi:hypothetical protein